MTARLPLVFGPDGLPQQLQSGDMLAEALIGSDPINLSLSAAVASNALTISVLGANGAAPSASNPVYIPCKTATGGLAWLAITSALSLTVPSGATLGTVSGVLARVWVVAINNGGTPLLGVKVCTDGATAIYPLGQGQQQTATAMPSSGGTAGTLYAASAATGFVAVLGTVEATEAAAGTWATAPSLVARWMPGDRLPGDVVQAVRISRTAAQNNTANAYGVFPFNATITPTSAANPIDVCVTGGDAYVSASGVLGYLRIARGNTASGVTVLEMPFGGGSTTIQIPASMRSIDFPATAAATVYAVQIKNSDNATNVIFPQAGTAALILEERMV